MSHNIGMARIDIARFQAAYYRILTFYLGVVTDHIFTSSISHTILVATTNSYYKHLEFKNVFFILNMTTWFRVDTVHLFLWAISATSIPYFVGSLSATAIALSSSSTFSSKSHFLTLMHVVQYISQSLYLWKKLSQPLKKDIHKIMISTCHSMLAQSITSSFPCSLRSLDPGGLSSHFLNLLCTLFTCPHKDCVTSLRQ